MNTDENVAVVLPSLDPSEKLVSVIEGLIGAGFRDIILIDDGSDSEHQQPFSDAQKLPGVTLLRHEVNKGKGAALKTAFRYILESRPDIAGAVTVDGDGQHLPPDVKNCARELINTPDTLIMGARDFSLPGIPARSRTGNRITSAVFRVCFGIKLRDTQTGLRGMSRELLPCLIDVPGDRFEYETNMLLELHSMGVPMREVAIETVYEDGNSSSHFRPVQDSIRIYGRILKYLASSLASSVVDLAAFWLLHLLLAPALGKFAVTVCTALARLISSFVNFNLNRRVFRSRRGYGSAMLRYYTLCVLQFAASAGLVSLFEHLLRVSSSGLITLIKAAVDTLLFIASFRIQQGWVFAQKKEDGR